MRQSGDADKKHKNNKKLQESGQDAGYDDFDTAGSIEKHARSRKFKIALAIILVIVAILVVCGFLVLTASITVNGKEISLLEYKNISEELTEANYENGYVFTDPDMEQACVTYDFDLSAVSAGSILISSLKHEEFDAAFTAVVDEEKLAAYIDAWNETAEKSVNAKIDEDWKITKEVYGTKIMKKKLIAAATAEGAEGIDPTEYYKQPSVTKKMFKAAKQEAKTYLNWSCSYDNGDVIETPETAVTITDEAEVVTDDSFLDSAIDMIDEDYNTVYDPVSFTTHGGETIEVSSGYWGYTMDADEELAFLKESFASGESVENRTPDVSGYGGEIGDTYVEVDISEQHVWVYVDGSVVMDTSCVTGRANKHDTPTGIYYILELKEGKYLTGDDYKTWVDYWMRCTWTGVGLHDASWRGSFGGSIYKTNGSHGCVNLPASFAADLYDMLYIGFPVCIHS